jgi:hypothetical protein
MDLLATFESLGTKLKNQMWFSPFLKFVSHKNKKKDIHRATDFDHQIKTKNNKASSPRMK